MQSIKFIVLNLLKKHRSNTVLLCYDSMSMSIQLIHLENIQDRKFENGIFTIITDG